MSFFSSVFGGGKAIESGLDVIDKAFYTDEEKAEQKIQLLQAYAPFKIAQRVLAFMFAGQFLLMVNVALYLHLKDKDVDEFLELAQTFGIDSIMITIAAFYFGGGALNSLSGLFSKKEKS